MKISCFPVFKISFFFLTLLSSRFNELKKLDSYSVCRTHMTNPNLSKPRPKDCPHKCSKMWIIVLLLLLLFIGSYFHRFNQNCHLNYISIPSHRGVYIGNGYCNMIECSCWQGQEID